MTTQTGRRFTRGVIAGATLVAAIAVPASIGSAAPAPTDTAPNPDAQVESETSADVAAAPRQRTLFAHTGAQTMSNYWDPPASQPSNYVSPVNYAGGHFYLKLDVLSKPSGKEMIPQLCMWRHGARKFQFETCTSNKLRITDEGTYWFDLGAAASWWKKAGGYSWTKPASVLRIMLKDPVTGKLFIANRCGAACYRGGDLHQHVPVQFRAEVIMVAKGSTLAPPANWAGCPAAWSPRC